MKSAQEQELERQRNRVKKYKSGNLLGKALDRSSKERSPSVNSISSDDSILSDKEVVAKKKKKKSDETDHSVDDEHARGENFQNIFSVCPRGTEFYFFFAEENHAQMMPGIAPYPMFNPETGQWLPAMYPYPTFFPPTHMMRPDFFPNPSMPYPPNNYRGGGGGNYRGRFPRGRGRSSYRGRGSYHSYGDKYNGHDDYEDSYDHKRGRNYRRRYIY